MKIVTMKNISKKVFKFIFINLNKWRIFLHLINQIYWRSPPTKIRITGMNSRSRTIAPSRNKAIPKNVNAKLTFDWALLMVVFIIPVRIGSELNKVPTINIPITMKIAPPTTIPMPARVASPIASES